jgi:KamA family protein
MDWQNQLRQSICTVDQLKPFIDISPSQERQWRHIIEMYPMRVTPYYLSLIDWDDPDDPIRRMALPEAGEMDISGSYDTSGEAQSTRMPGLQHKYAQTALILTTNRCAVYCRYCFRKRLIGRPTEEILTRFRDAARYIEKHKEITNVLLSGGDPLILPTRVIERFLERLSTIEHLRYIRIGSRLPLTFPVRLLEDRELINVFRKYARKPKQLHLVTQFNHPREITRRSSDAIATILTAGIPVSNQAILLKGVNDKAETLAELHKRLVGIGVHPYYLFQCRPVRRVKLRYQVPIARGVEIVEKTRLMLDGISKRFRYVMSHKSGKVEILGIHENKVYMKYHQARDPANLGRFLVRKVVPGAGWLDEMPRLGALKAPAGGKHG